MRRLSALFVAVASLFAASGAQAMFINVDDFNSPDMLVADQSGGGATVVNSPGGVPFGRVVSHNLLSGPNDVAGTGSKVSIGSQSFPTGSLEVANANGRDSEVKVDWTLGAGVVPTTAAGPASMVFTILQSDGNPTQLELFVNNVAITPVGGYFIPGNTKNDTNYFALGAAAQNALAAGGTMRLVLNGAEGWDLSLDSFGIQVPEPGSMALAGLALLIGGVVTRRRKA